MANTFLDAFRQDARAGDSIETAPDARGLFYRARLEYDDSGDRPDDNDEGFWPSQDPKAAGYVLPDNFNSEMTKAQERMRAWESDEWCFVGVVLSAHIIVNGTELALDNHAASLWGIESDSGGYLTDIANELLGEAEDAAAPFVASLRAQLENRT
jgi:hypothetical protein